LRKRPEKHLLEGIGGGIQIMKKKKEQILGDKKGRLQAGRGIKNSRLGEHLAQKKETL